MRTNAYACFFGSLLPWIVAKSSPPWPMILQDVGHGCMLSRDMELPPSLPDVKWSYKAKGEVESSAVVGESLVFAAGGSQIFAVDKATGKRVWKFKAQSQVLASGALGGDAFFIGTDDRHFYALQQDTGKLLWKFKAGEFTGGAVVDEKQSVVYVGSGARKLHAYFFNGTKQFDFVAAANVASTPALDEKSVYFGDDDGYFYKLDRSTGKKIWRVKFESGIRSPPKLHTDGIFIGIGDPDDKKSGKIVHLDYDGKVMWEADCGRKKSACGSCWTSPAIVDGLVIAGCGLDSIQEGSIWGLDKETGSVRWRFKAGNDCQTSSPVAVGKSVLIGCTDGNLYALNAADGTSRWHFQTAKGIWATPALDADGTIYIGSHSGHLYALGGQSDRASGSAEIEVGATGRLERDAL